MTLPRSFSNCDDGRPWEVPIAPRHGRDAIWRELILRKSISCSNGPRLPTPQSWLNHRITRCRHRLYRSWHAQAFLPWVLGARLSIRITTLSESEPTDEAHALSLTTAENDHHLVRCPCHGVRGGISARFSWSIAASSPRRGVGTDL